MSKASRSSRWNTQTKKVNEFNTQYPEVSTGDLYVNRYRNQLVTYTPYTYLNSKKTAEAVIPLQYNSCEELQLTYSQLSSGLIREYADHIDFYLNNFRSDSTAQKSDKIVITGVTAEPSYTLTKHGIGSSSATPKYDAEAKTYTVEVKHYGPLTLTINCTGDQQHQNAGDAIPEPAALPIPQQPEDWNGPVIIEAEDMDYKNIKGMSLTNAGYYFPDVLDYAGNGWADMGTSTAGSLRHQLNCKHPGQYTIAVRYTNTSRAGQMKTTVNGNTTMIDLEKTAKNEWRKATFDATLQEGKNNLILTNSAGIAIFIDQIIYTPAGTEPDKFLVSIRPAKHGTITASATEAAEGETITLSVNAEEGFQLKQLRVINSVYYTLQKTITLGDNTDEITFTMPDDNVTLQPVFADVSSVMKLDFAEVQNGTMPQGWRTVQEDNQVHEYPNSYGQGARTMAGFGGHQGKALYWRNDRAEYGRQTAYPLVLEPGKYKLTWAMAAWKGSPQYKVQVLSTSNSSIATSAVTTATPNANGSTSANLASAQNRELEFAVTTKGNYIISFTDATTSGGYHEFLLLECRVNSVKSPDGIQLVDATGLSETAIYNLSGVRQQQVGRGLNIIRTADGKTRKIMKR